MNKNITEDYEKKGYVVLKNLINTNDVQKYINIAKRHDHKAQANAVVDYFYDYIRFFDLRLYGKFLRFLDFRYILDCNFLISKSRDSDWRNYFSLLNIINPKNLIRIDSYISKKSDEDILEWHTDQAFGGATHPVEFFGNASGTVPTKNTNKLFLHLTDVKFNNGAFSYIPFSHKINMAIRLLINKNEIKYKPFLLLKDAVDIIENHNEKFLKLLNDEEIKTFLKHAKKAFVDDQDFSIECKAGDAVLFNDFGYHKGTAPKLSNRIIFRYFYK